MKPFHLSEETKDKFPIGTNVNVKRLLGDAFAHDFTGHVKGYHYNMWITVEDQDGDCWDCETEQVSLSSDDVMHENCR
jgi:3D (Asp-Asp-Asp) domain-containing protein